MNRSTTGRAGEDLAVLYLQRAGYQVVQRNWRCGRYETDIIARKEATLHFVEVKTLRALAYGWPEDHVTIRKLRHMMIAAEGYLHLHPAEGRIQLDILAVRLWYQKPPAIFLLEDVYI